MIPFNRPYVPELSKKYVLEALQNIHQHGDGPFAKRSTDFISNILGGAKVFLTPSCTHALEIASMAIGISPGDEVIIPSFNFTSAATAVTKFGGVPIFVDIDPETLCIDTNLVEKHITSRTKAISWVNYAGSAPNLNELIRIKNKYKIILIEDNAHGLGANFNGKPLGTFGDISTLSFHSTKNIQCGEGGAVIINNLQFLDKTEIIREKGTNRKDYNNSKVKKYQWVGLGSSYLMNEISAAVLLGQLESFNYIQKHRKQIYFKYLEIFSKYLHLKPNLKLNDELLNFTTGHIFYFLTESNIHRESLIEKGINFDIHLTSHYQPLHKSPQGQKYLTSLTNCPISEGVSEKIIRLPIWVGLNFEHTLISKLIFNAY